MNTTEDAANQNIVPLPMIEAEEGGVEEALGYSPVKYSTSTMAPTALVLAAEHPQQQLLHDESVYGVQRVYKRHSPETHKCFLHLFGSLLEASGQHKDATAVPLERLPEEVRTELRDLFLPGKEGGPDLVLDKNVMTQGLFDMTEAFISGHNRCRRINELRNAYFRNILMNIYVDSIQWTKEEEKLRARDVITINSCVRKLVEPTELEVSSPRTDASPQLLRSSSVGTEQVSGGGRSTLQEHLSPESSAALAKVVEMQGLTWDEQANLVWSLESQVTSKLRFNVVVQDLANMYLLTKLKRAYLVLRGATLAISPLAVGDRVVFVDYYFMPHLCTVTRARPGLVYDILLDAGREVRNIPRVDLEPSSAPKPADVSLVGNDAAALKPGDVDAVDDAVPMDDQLSPAALPPVPVDNVAWEVRYADAEAAIAPLLETALAGAHVPRIHDPTPKNYYLFFTEDGVRKEFYFDNRDIGLKFGELYAHCGVPAAVLEEHPRVVRETNRCFFLHLGLATGLNPFKLQACFRSEARRQRGAAVANLEVQINAAVAAAEAAPNSTPEERLAQQALEEEATRLFLESPTDLFDSVLQEGAMVDMEVLTKIWPAELSDIRICLVPLYYSRYSSEKLDNIICYTPLNSACNTADGWTGRDIVMKRLGAHFTWLAAPADTVELHGAEPLIDRFLRNMRNCESPVIMRDVSIQYDLHV